MLVRTDLCPAQLGSPTQQLAVCSDDHLIAVLIAYPVAFTLNRKPQGGCELMWLLPPGPDPRPIDHDALAHVVWAVENGEACGVLGTDQAAVDLVRGMVEVMAGGGHA